MVAALSFLIGLAEPASSSEPPATASPGPAAPLSQCLSSSVQIKKPVTPPTAKTTNPAGFADLVEVVRGTVGKPIRETIWDVDTNSIIEINLFAAPIKSSPPTSAKLGIKVTLFKGDASTDFALPDKWQWTPCGDTLFLGPRLDMNDRKIKDKDTVRVIIENQDTSESVTFDLTRRDLGWHRSTSDTVAFVQRLGVSKQDVANGIAKINFGPSPGVTLATVYTPRRDEKPNFLSFLSPGIGITASFLDWKDQNVTLDTTNPSMPTFAAGANLNQDIRRRRRSARELPVSRRTGG